MGDGILDQFGMEAGRQAGTVAGSGQAVETGGTCHHLPPAPPPPHHPTTPPPSPHHPPSPPPSSLSLLLSLSLYSDGNRMDRKQRADELDRRVILW